MELDNLVVQMDAWRQAGFQGTSFLEGERERVSWSVLSPGLVPDLSSVELWGKYRMWPSGNDLWQVMSDRWE